MICIIAAALLCGCSKQQTKTPQWEYRTIEFRKPDASINKFTLGVLDSQMQFRLAYFREQLAAGALTAEQVEKSNAWAHGVYYASIDESNIADSVSAKFAIDQMISTNGADGWELVSTSPSPAESESTLYIFKRQAK